MEIMLKKIYEEICAGKDVRANLIELKMQLKSEKNQTEFRRICGKNYDVIMKCLVHEDAKVRKNAVSILGLLRVQEAVDVLMDAYLEEDKLFVRSEYVTALANLDCEPYLDEFHKRLEELTAYDAPENEKKHVQAEIHALQELILGKEGLKKHSFRGYDRANEVILTTLPAFRDALAEEISSKKVLLKSGVRTVVGDMREILQNRLWQEMLFVLNCGKKIAADPQTLAEELKNSDLMAILSENHSGTAPFYFRVGISGAMPMEQRSEFAKKVSLSIEGAFGRELLNSTSHYEVEIRLIQNREGSFMPCLKLFTIPDRRFYYRRYHVAASMKPVLAAGILALAKPYLREHAQVLDPFCGVGTLLIERRFLSPVRNAYGIDTFGEAIEKARANTKLAGMQANYINRSFFDFEHDYEFDEIITDMPAGNLGKEELDRIYRRFFEKSAGLLSDKGRIILYSKEMGLVKKYLRLKNNFRLLKEFCIAEKSGAYLFVLEKSGMN